MKKLRCLAWMFAVLLLVQQVWAEPVLIDFKPTQLTTADFQPLRSGKAVNERPLVSQGIYGPPNELSIRFLVIPGRGLDHPGNPQQEHPCRFVIQRRNAEGDWVEAYASQVGDLNLECERLIVIAKNDKGVKRGTQGMLLNWQGLHFLPLREPLILPGKYAYLSQDPIYMLNEQESPHGKAAAEQRIMLNEIFARHGFIFQAGGEMDQYFRQQSWYKPERKEVNNLLTPVEKWNIKELRTILKPENIAAREGYLSFLKAFCAASESDNLVYLKAHVALPFRIRGTLDGEEVFLKTWDGFLKQRKKLLITKNCYDPHYYDKIGFSSRYHDMDFIEQGGSWKYGTIYDDELYAALSK